jgi:hypothetical protein
MDGVPANDFYGCTLDSRHDRLQRFLGLGKLLEDVFQSGWRSRCG